ncbi:FRG domain-containing protein [Rossellomorea vietnamensis]|uniref:FRG domain-containing protein n=1 Tax=Rossellomorea vietnamensis TaxID=218284 RepID=UPI003CF2181A
MFSRKWNLFMGEINDFYVKNEGNVWFRGHSNKGKDDIHETFKLTSGLFRGKEDLNATLKLENNYIYEFLHNGFSIHKTENIWALLFIMQHHGVPTRFLDWTKSVSSALYFARQGWVKGAHNPSVWLLNPSKMNEVLGGEDDIIVLPTKASYFKFIKSLDNSQAIASIKNTPRINSQQGHFTMQGNTLLPLDEELREATGRNDISDICKEIVIDSDLTFDLSVFLEMNGSSHFTMFPDLDGLSREIKGKYY